MKIQGVTDVAAGTTNPNILSGSAFEFMRTNAVVRFYLVDLAAGNLRATVQAGSDILMEESPLSRAARMPIVPDDLTIEDVVGAGDRLVVRVRNAGGVVATLFWAVEIVELTGGAA